MRTQPEQIIQQLESDNSRLAKERILRDAMNEGLSEFFQGVSWCLDPMMTFGVKQVPIKDAADAGTGLPWPAFAKLVNQLFTRELTGHAARDAILLCMDVATVPQWNDFYRRILIKDLRCGLSEKTVNKAAKNFLQYQVPVFECQLAHDSANHEAYMTGLKQIEVKLDGVRVLTVIHDCAGEKIEMLSRNGKQFHNFDHVIAEIRSVLKHSPAPYPLVLDGEIMSASFQDLMRQVQRKTNANATDAVLNLFDVIPLGCFINKRWDKPQSFRSELVKGWVADHADEMPHVTALDWETVNLSDPAGMLRYIEINRLAVAGKYEGVMIKDPDAPYESKRSRSWLKAKPFIEITMAIEDVEEGTGKNAGSMGALVCSGEDEGRDIRVNVGSGFSDDMRQAIWDQWLADKTKLLKQLVEVRADAVTQNRDGTYSLRFPRFKTFRGFRPGEKL